MLAWAFALVGKGCKRPLNLSVQASTAPGHRTLMPQQLRRLHRMPAQPENSPEEQHQPHNNSGGAPSRLACISEQIWAMQQSFATMKSSADAPVDSIRDTIEGSFDQRFATLKSIGEERVNEHELKLLLKKKSAPICYVWCDPSPWMHISQGIMKTISVNKMVKSGCKVKILMADWFARMNREIGGNLNKMLTIGLYNIEMWKATGMVLDEVELVWLSDEIS